jgi:hypothetical protein
LYSARNLTYENDKLPAVSGLAASVNAILGEDIYLAGIWEKDLIRGVLWTPASAATGASSSNRVPNIPSWSWASYPGGIRSIATGSSVHQYPWPEYLHDHCLLRNPIPTERNEDAVKIDGRTTVCGLDPFGSVRDGPLKITTIMKAYDIGIPLGCSECRTLDDETAIKIILDDKSSQIHSKAVFAAILSDPGGDLHNSGLVQIILGVPSGGVQDGGVHSFGLILRQTGADTFNRLGIFYARSVKDYGFKLCTVTVT